MKDALSYLFAFLVEAIILWQYSSNLFVAKHTSRLRILTLCCLYLILWVISLFELKELNMVLYLLFNSIFLFTQYSLKWYSALFHSAILSAFMGICELIVYSIINRFSPHFWAQAEHFHNRILFVIFSKIIFFSIIYILIYFQKKQQKQTIEQDKSVLLLLCIPATSIFIMLTFLNINESYTLSSYSEWSIMLSSLFLLFINLLVFGINRYNQRKGLEYANMQLLLQKESDSTEYYEMLRLQNENQRILIHDIKNHLQSINLLNRQGEQNKVDAYIQQLVRSSSLKESARLCDHDMLNSILCRYMQQCNNSHIAFHTDVRSGTMNFIADNDLTSLFGNLLDNAVEAASTIPEAYIELTISKREKTPFIVITLINSCRKNPFLNGNDRLLSTKSDKRKHGFGLISIRRTINKYQGDIQMYYDNDTLTFHTIITLKQ